MVAAEDLAERAVAHHEAGLGLAADDPWLLSRVALVWTAIAASDRC